MSTVAQYRAVTQQSERFVAQFEKTPAYKRDVQQFKEAAASGKLDSVEALLKDRRSLTVVLSAFQLEEQVNATGLLRKVLSQDVEDGGSLVNRLSDQRYKQLAKALAPLAKGEKPFASAQFVNTLVGSYRTNEFEKYQGEQTDGLREALYFKRNIGTVTSAMQILSSKPMTTVIREALGLPPEFSMLDVKKQAALIAKRVDITRLKEPAYAEKLVNQFLARTDANASATSTNPMASLLSGSSGASGLLNLLV